MQTFIEAYRKELLEVNNFSPTTVQNYVSCLGKYFCYAKALLKIDPLKTKSKHVRHWMSGLKRQGLGRSRLIHHQAALKRFFAVLIKLNVLKRNPAAALFHIKKQKSERNQPIPPQKALRLLRAIKRDTWLDERNFVMISLLWGLGLRVGELTSLKVESFEPDHDPQNKIGLLRVRGKGNKERALFVVDKLYDNVVAYLAHPESPKAEVLPMFPATLKNKALSVDRLQRIIKHLVRHANLKQRITPHVLRHSFATHLYERDVPVEAIEAMLGHSSTEETSIYIHVPETKKQQALEKLTIHGRTSCQ